MKKISIFSLVLLLITALWCFAISFFEKNFSLSESSLISNNTFSAVTSMFTVFAMLSIVYVIILMAIDLKTNQLNFEKSVLSNKSHLEIVALTALIQECDATLFRYDRWEEAGIKGDYMNAKTSVRDKMNNYRVKLEQIYEGIE